MYLNGAGMFMMAWMGLLTLGLIAAVVAAVVWLAHSDLFASRHGASGVNPAEAEAVLRRRYVAGEIDDEEFGHLDRRCLRWPRAVIRVAEPTT